jgi:hypothetical protein
MKYVGEIIGKGIALGGGSAIGNSIVEAIRSPLAEQYFPVEKYCSVEAKLFQQCLEKEELISSCIGLLEQLKECEKKFIKTK